MSLRRIVMAVVGAAAFAAWFSAAMTPGRPPLSPAAFAPAAVDARGAELASEIARLRERLRPSAVPREPARNPFVFRSAAPVRPSAGAPAGASGVPVAPATHDVPVGLARLRLSLAGIAEDEGAGGVVRTAIVSAAGQLHLLKVGDVFSDAGVTYQVRGTTAGSVDLVDARDGAIVRLSLP